MPKIKRKQYARWALLALLVFLILLAGFTGGGILGYQSAMQARQVLANSQVTNSLQEQYQLGLQDLNTGNFEVARQRFEFVLAQEPGYPGAADQLAKAMAVLYATATPTPLPPTITPTPTRDLRPVQEMFDQVKSLLASGDWTATIDTLVSLRKEDFAYQTARVDGMLYLALRNRGISKILNEGNLEGGIYDLALAEQFGPIDGQADTARTWARLYLFGLSFWEAYPEQAVYYFGQIAAAAPGLRDISGWTAAARYRAVLIQYADQLARAGDWCRAQEQYELALSMTGENNLQATAAYAAEQCSPPTSTATATATFTPTLTVTLSPTPLIEVTTTTPEFLPTWTFTPTPPTIPPTTVVPSDTPTPTETSLPPSDTLPPPTPTDTPPPPEPTATNTLAPP